MQVKPQTAPLQTAPLNTHAKVVYVIGIRWLCHGFADIYTLAHFYIKVLVKKDMGSYTKGI